MRKRLWPFLAVVALSSFGLLGCHGPKSDCEGTMHSYESIIDGNHWDDFPDIVFPAQRHMFHDKILTKWIASEYEGARSFKFTAMQASVAGDVCLVQAQTKWEQKIRGKNPETYDGDYVTYTLHQIEGKWYMEVPGASKLQAF